MLATWSPNMSWLTTLRPARTEFLWTWKKVRLLFFFFSFFNLNLIMFNLVNISYFTPLLQMEVQVQMDLVTGMSQSALGLTQT